jgi:hypothetical protein
VKDVEGDGRCRRINRRGKKNFEGKWEMEEDEKERIT